MKALKQSSSKRNRDDIENVIMFGGPQKRQWSEYVVIHDFPTQICTGMSGTKMSLQYLQTPNVPFGDDLMGYLRRLSFAGTSQTEMCIIDTLNICNRYLNRQLTWPNLYPYIHMRTIDIPPPLLCLKHHPTSRVDHKTVLDWVINDPLAHLNTIIVYAHLGHDAYKIMQDRLAVNRFKIDYKQDFHEHLQLGIDDYIRMRLVDLGLGEKLTYDTQKDYDDLIELFDGLPIDLEVSCKRTGRQILKWQIVISNL